MLGRLLGLQSILFLVLFYYLFFRSRKCLGKILLMSGPLFGKIFGSELLFFGVGVGRVSFCAVLPLFLLYYLVFRSRKCLEKILSMSGGSSCSLSLASVFLSVCPSVCLSVCLSVWSGRGCPWSPKKRAPRRVRQSVSQSHCGLEGASARPPPRGGPR